MDNVVKEIRALRDQLNSTIEQRDGYFRKSQNWEGKYERQSQISRILLAIIIVTNLAWILR